MALGKKENTRSPIIYVTLSRSEDYGFKHVTGSGENRKVDSYDHVTGVPVGFYMKPEVIYEVAKELRAKGINPNTVDTSKYEDDQLKFVATLMLKDPANGEMVGVNFDMHDSLGGKIIGLLNTAIIDGVVDQDMSLRTFYAAPKSKYNDSEKGRSSVNMRQTADGSQDLKPTFVTAGGAILKDDKGQNAMLPMGKVVAKVKGKDIWDFSDRNAVITETALVVFDHFKKQAPADQNHDDGGVDLDEAAAAAAPKG